MNGSFLHTACLVFVLATSQLHALNCAMNHCDDFKEGVLIDNDAEDIKEQKVFESIRKLQVHKRFF